MIADSQQADDTITVTIIIYQPTADIQRDTDRQPTLSVENEQLKENAETMLLYIARLTVSATPGP